MADAWVLVYLESPYAGKSKEDVEGVARNLKYLRRCMHDCIMRHEAPFASHGLYTQEGVLDDTIPEERKLGIEAGFAWARPAAKTVMYCDLGFSRGMKYGIKNALVCGRPIELRYLDGRPAGAPERAEDVDLSGLS